MHVLVTGGAGFIGTNLCQRLLLEPHVSRISVIDDLATSTGDNVPSDVRFIEGSILNVDLLEDAARGVDAIVHLAALGSVPRSISDPLASHHANATGTLRVLEAARGANNAHVVLASSSSVYGANDAIPKHEALQCLPMSPYAVSKLAAEQYAMAYARCYGLPVLPFRFFNVFGPYQQAGHAYAAVIPAFLAAALAGTPLPIHGDGSQSRDFTYVGTLVEVVTQAIVRGVESTPVNLAFGTRTSLRELVQAISTAVGHEVETQTLDPRRGDVPHSQAANGRLTDLFPDVNPVSLADGLSVTAEWMKQTMSRESQ